MTTFHPQAVPDLILIEPRAVPDARGFFLETYKASTYRAGGIPQTFVQDNHSRSVRGTLRGLHFQAPPNAQGKLVSVTRGEILDVAVDLRRGSPTFSRWVAVRLSDENHRQLYLPVGFAHGFLVLSEEADLTYKVTSEYVPESDRGILWNDPDLGIAWGIRDPLLSERDQNLPRFAEADIPFEYRVAKSLAEEP